MICISTIGLVLRLPYLLVIANQLLLGFVDLPLIISGKNEFLGYLFLQRVSLGHLIEPVFVIREVGAEARLLALAETNVPYQTTKIKKVEYEV